MVLLVFAQKYRHDMYTSSEAVMILYGLPSSPTNLTARENGVEYHGCLFP